MLNQLQSPIPEKIQTNFPSIFHRPIKHSRLELEARNILARIHEHDSSSGGVVLECTGMPGSGKSSVLLSFANYALIHHPDEKVWWSNPYNAPIDVFKLGEGKFQILVQKDSDVYFWDRIQEKEVELNVTYFDGFKDCYEKSEPGVVNVPFFGKPRTIEMDWISYLKLQSGWKHCFCDEFAEICPSYTNGKMFHKIGKFSNFTVGQLRKCNCNLFWASQSYSDIDPRPRKKIMIKLMLPGAKTDRKTRVFQKTVDGLQRSKEFGNQAMVDFGGPFGKIQFSNIYEPVPGLCIDARRRNEPALEIEEDDDEKQ